MRQLLCWLLAVVATFAAAARGEIQPTTLDKPLFVQLTLREGNERLSGSLVRYDAKGLIIKSGKGERALAWDQLSGPSLYGVRSQLIDRKDASEWLELAELAMQNGLKEQAKLATAQAARIDPKTRLKGDAILRSQGAAKPTTQVSASSDDKAGATGDVERFQKPTPEQEAAAMDRARKASAAIQKAMSIRLAEFETPHFLVFTDWPQDQHGFLKENLEGAYVAVARQFAIPATENVFVGKLPVYMFERKADFERFAVRDGGLPQAAGYYAGRSDGSGHLVMPKPDVKAWGPRMAEVVWARVLTHEFTHAFVARYRTNRFIPRWLNEGTAEVIAFNQFPDAGAYGCALDMANKDFDFMRVFGNEPVLNGDLYPVYYTLVEALVRDNPKAFIAMFNDIKDGMEAEEALKKHFHVTYKEMYEPWVQYVRNRR